AAAAARIRKSERINEKGRVRPCLALDSKRLLLVRLFHLLVGLLGGLLVRLLGGLLVRLLLHLVLRAGVRRRDGRDGYRREHRGNDQREQLAHFLLLFSVRTRVDAYSCGYPARITRQACIWLTRSPHLPVNRQRRHSIEIW